VTEDDLEGVLSLLTAINRVARSEFTLEADLTDSNGDVVGRILYRPELGYYFQPSDLTY
jgi:hypothetical protein